MIPYGRQEITDEDIAAVVDTLKSSHITQGPIVPRFEAAIANYCGAAHAVASNSATSALHLACMALELGPSDWLWTTPNTFAASANCALYCGAQVDFVDIDARTHNLCPRELANKLEAAKSQGRLPKVVVPVHLCGQSCDMESIHRLSRQYGFKIIEDASHAIGGKYKGKPIGGCQYSDITVFSFHPVKIITTAEGGMGLTNSPALADKMALFRSHGITRDPDKLTKDADGPWYYEQIALGYNYRLTDIQAALGLSQMSRLDDYVSARQRLAARYDRLLQDLPVVTPWVLEDCYSALHLYVVRVETGADLPRHRTVFESLHDNGIGVNLHYIPVHTHPYYAAMGFEKGDFPEAEAYYHCAISLPMFPTMAEADQDLVVAALTKALQR